ncbi:MAG: hypothetical protein ACLU84_04050 [Clostridia bacterium]
MNTEIIFPSEPKNYERESEKSNENQFRTDFYNSKSFCDGKGPRSFSH